MHDSIFRLLQGYRNVRIYRSDFQSVCDSMTAVSTDSTIHLYVDPVLWNEQNQITSEVMDIFTRNRQLARADFVGAPMMANRLDSIHYNQIAGKEMTAYFRDTPSGSTRSTAMRGPSTTIRTANRPRSRAFSSLRAAASIST